MSTWLKCRKRVPAVCRAGRLTFHWSGWLSACRGDRSYVLCTIPLGFRSTVSSVPPEKSHRRRDRLVLLVRLAQISLLSDVRFQRRQCGEVVKEVVLLNYPNFFTPNGDGVHDKWRIEYAIREPNIKINIFDRYGKLITVFGANSEGWDGTLNGNPLPSTDYWFVVEREDGRQLKGHFAMLR